MAKTTFVDGDPQQQILGTIVAAAFLNVVNNHYHDGLDVDGHGALPYAADSGAADAYVLTLFPALTQYVTGMPISFKATNANTGASTINMNSLGVKSIKKNYNQDLKVNDILANQVITIIYDGTNFQMVSPPGTSKPYDYICVTDEKASGTNGGTFTSGAWQTRTLNTVRNNDNSVASLGSNQITLPAGTYECDILCPANSVNYHQTKLRNITAGSDILIGSSENTNAPAVSPEITTHSVIKGSFTLSATTILEVQHYCSGTKANTGFGQPCGFGVTEVYTIAKFKRIR